MTRQPWIGPPAFDLALIIGPGVLASLVVLVMPGWFEAGLVTPLLWAALVVGVDVTHVYSTLWRTYFDPAEFRRARVLYTLAPLLGWGVFAVLYSLGAMVFWRCLAYLAVFHFVRQQYGFMMLYGRGETRYRRIDQAAIYAATLYPLLWWHLHPRQFDWFIEGDFLTLDLPLIGQAALAVYVGILIAYVAKEAASVVRTRRVNWPRNLLLGSTALSWWVGIMVLDSDLAFTAVNVLAHGVPYLGLVWLYGRRRPEAVLWGGVPGRVAFSVAAVPLFLLVPLLLAYLEEGVWDRLVWTEHPGLFPLLPSLSPLQGHEVLALVVPLLALPQVTHYILDGFIWRRHHAAADWRASLASVRPL